MILKVTNLKCHRHLEKQNGEKTQHFSLQWFSIQRDSRVFFHPLPQVHCSIPNKHIGGNEDLFPQRKHCLAAFWTVLTQIWWFVRRSCIRQQSIQFLPLQSAVKGLLFAKGGEGPLCPRLGFWCFKHFSVWNRVHTRNVKIAAVIRSLASIRRDKRGHPAPIRVAQCFTFFRAIREEIHAYMQEREKKTADIIFSITTSCWLRQ